MSFEPKFLCTGIGSMPFSDAEHAVKQSIDNFAQAPFWPQLPRTDLREQMEIQYSEGMPRAVIQEEKQRMFFDTSGDYSEDCAAFYENYMTAMDPDEGTGNCSALAISSAFSRGIPALLKRVETQSELFPYIKVQTTGPVSFALTMTDENKRAIYYKEDFRDIIVKALAMKCRWQIQTFQPYAEKIICFIDEPILSAFGSSTYVSVTRDDVVGLLTEMVEAIHADNALAGIHCCGNTEWSIPIDAGVDIVNFDAFDYGESVAMYDEAVRGFLQRGGALAWGIVPTSETLRNETTDTLARKYESRVENLAAKGIEKNSILRQTIITPSCGTGSLSPDLAESVFNHTRILGETLRERHL